MYSIETLIVTGAVSFLIGFISHLFFSTQGMTLEKRVAVIILVSWMSFAMIAYLQNKDLSIFFNAAGMGAVGNLLGIKTSEWIKDFLPKR